MDDGCWLLVAGVLTISRPLTTDHYYRRNPVAKLSVWARSADKQSKERMVTLAKKDLAQMLETNPDYIEVVEVKTVVWVDAMLGYPQPGKKVVPGYVPGYQITLRYSERNYDYHASFNRVIYVPAGKSQAPLPASTL
jgi:hypothetical protein